MKKLTEEFIKQLPEELQQKARECKTAEELNTFIADNDLELPEEALELVSGGILCSGSQKRKCPKCGSDDVYYDRELGEYVCRPCGKKWR
ncbi:MAG: hypothetical protein J6O40_02305 [Ruminococcus sp.]|nr:hypothetical protein [Ruminococcus sp.]